jgi:hypothetical protein
MQRHAASTTGRRHGSPFAEEAVRDLDLPGETKHTLTGVGVPGHTPFADWLPPAQRIPLFSEQANALGWPSPASWANFYCIGWKDVGALCLEKGTGVVWFIDRWNEKPTIANTTLRQFIACAQAVDQAAADTAGKGDRAQSGHDLAQTLASIDPVTATTGYDSWGAVAEEFGYGF